MGQGGGSSDMWQLKRVNSETGPSVNTTLSDAIRSEYSVPGQTEVLWSSSSPGDFEQLKVGWF